MTNERVLLLSTLILFSKYYTTILIQGKNAFTAGTRPPEDQKLNLNKGNNVQSYGTEVNEKMDKARLVDLRWRRLVLNDVENIPMGLILFLMSVGTNQMVYKSCMSVFVLARILHSVAYAFEIQPMRGLCWMAGVASCFTVGLSALF